MMRRLQLVCLLCLLYLALMVWAEEEELVEVTLQGLGGLRGKTGEARNKEKYYQFLGVPFAEPPTGENRSDQHFQPFSSLSSLLFQIPWSSPCQVLGG